jgi:PAS domain S-box-containing protein
MLGAHTDVTPIKKVEERLRAIDEASPDMYFTAKLATGTILDCNQSLAEGVQRPEADIVGRSFVELCRPEYRAAAQAALGTLRSLAAVNDLELGLDRRDGPALATVLTARVISSEAGTAPFVRAWCRDITHLRRRANIQVLVDALPSAAVLLDSDGVIAMLNAPAERMFGHARGELLGQPLQLLFPALAAARVAGTRVAGPPMAQLAQPASQEIAASRRDGTTFPAQVHFGPIDTREGPLTLVEIVDATERKKAEVALRDSEHRFRQLADSLPQLVWTCDPDGRCDYLGRQWIEYTGIEAEPQLGDGWQDQLHPDDRADVAARWQRSVLEGQRLQVEYRLRGHDGRYRFFDVRAVPLRDSGGTIVKWFGANTDITERKLAEDELRTSRTHLTAALAAGQMGTWIFDPEQDRMMLDDAAARLWGLPAGPPPAAGAGAGGGAGVADRTSSGLRTLLQRVDPEHRPMLAGWPAATPAAPVAGGQDARPDHDTVEFRVLCPDGATRWIASRGRRERDAAGRTTWMGVIQDVTARRDADEVRLRSQKLEALGTLAGGIAHDFNNVLTAIAGNLQLALVYLPGDHRVRTFLDEIDTAVNRAADLVRRILTFGRPQEADRAVTAVGGIVAEALRLLRATLPATIQIGTDLPDDLPLVAVDPTQVHQVIMNLGTNAAHAMGPTGGNLTLQASCVRPEPEFAQRSGLGPEPYVRVSVRDDGCGMDEATRARIFDPFFTTKPTGEGTGLGLSMVHRIMQAQGGAVAVHSSPGLGTEFELYFPVAADPAPDDAAEAGPEEAASGQQRVLFVDDERAITTMAEALLQSLGHEVTTANHPADAVELFRAAPDAFDVLITDFTMPGMSGVGLATALREIRADLPVVLCSGLLSDGVLEFARDRDLVHVLTKPYLGADLARALNAMFTGRKPGRGP